MKKLALCIALLAAFVSSSAFAGHGRVRGHRNYQGVRGGVSIPADLTNNYAIDFDGTDDYADYATAMNPTTGAAWFVRVDEDEQLSNDTIISKDDNASQRTMVSGVATTGAGFGDMRIALCTTLSACGVTKVTNLGPNRLTPFTSSLGGWYDYPSQTMRIYVDGAAQDLTAVGTVPASAPASSTALWTWGAKYLATGSFDYNGRMDDLILWIDQIPSSQCFWELSNWRGSRTLPSSCPTPSSWCRGGDDNSGTGTTCSNYLSPGTRDITLHNATFVAATNFTKLPSAPAAVVSNATYQAFGAVGQSNISGSTNTLADVDPQSSTYPNFPRICIARNDGSLVCGSSTVEPTDDNLALTVAQTWRYADLVPTYVDETTDSNSGAAADIAPFPAVELTGDAFFIGSTAQFGVVRIDNVGGTAGIGGTVAWEYCSAASGGACTAWTTVAALSDATVGFTAAVADGRVVSFTRPTDWAQTAINGSASLFYIRARVTGTYVTNPVLDQILFSTQAQTYATGEDTAPRVSPMGAFANSMATALPNHLITIIPTAKGGSNLADTAASSWTPAHAQTTRLFGGARTRYTTDLPTAHEIAGLVVYQGEAENADTTAWNANNHRYRMAMIIQAFRDWLGNDTPVVIVNLPVTVPTGYDSTRWTTVRDGISSMCSLIRHDCAVVQAPSGPYADANLHLSASAQLVLGPLIATAMAGLLSVTP